MKTSENFQVWSCALLLAGATAGVAAPAIGPEFTGAYNITSPGAVPGVPMPYGGLVFKAGDNNKILIGGSANNNDAAIYEIQVVRNAQNHVTGFSGRATLLYSATGPGGGGIDGGLVYGPGNVLMFTTYSDHYLGQIKPGSATPDKFISLGALEFESSVGSLTIVPPNFPGAGRIKILSYGASIWYDATLTADNQGTFNISKPARALTFPEGNGPEGAIFVASGNPQFTKASVIISEYSAQKVSAYEIDSNGDPVFATGRIFVDNLPSAQGAAIDPVTGDFLFSTYDTESTVYVVGGFTVNPSRTPPTVQLTSPNNQETFAAPAEVYFTANAAGSGGALISRVEYYHGTNLLGSATASPYHFTWQSVPAGNYALTARAFDNSGLSSTSAVVNIAITNVLNQPPVVSLTNLASNATFVACSLTTLSANAFDQDGSVTNVEIYVGQTRLASLSSPPYQCLWSRMAMGTYSVTARARDDQGAVGISTPITVQVVAPETNRLVAERLGNGQFALCLACAQGTTNEIQVSQTLTNWTVLTNFISTNAVSEYIDRSATNYPLRFYRAKQQ